MYLVYIDESGNTGANLDSPDQPIHWLIALAATPAMVTQIETEMLAIAGRYFGLRARAADFEFHGAHIFSGRTTDYRQLSVADRVRLFNELLSLIGRFGVRLFVRGINKAAHKDRARDKGYPPDHPHRLGFMYLVEQVDEWLEAMQPAPDLFAAREPIYGLIVADEQNEVRRDVVSGFAAWRQYGTEHGYRARHIRYLIDTVHYVPSQDSWLIQLADCVAFVRNRYGKIFREKGFHEARYSESDRAIVHLWRDLCAPHVVSACGRRAQVADMKKARSGQTQLSAGARSGEPAPDRAYV